MRKYIICICWAYRTKNSWTFLMTFLLDKSQDTIHVKSMQITGKARLGHLGNANKKLLNDKNEWKIKIFLHARISIKNVWYSYKITGALTKFTMMIDHHFMIMSSRRLNKNAVCLSFSTIKINSTFPQHSLPSMYTLHCNRLKTKTHLLTLNIALTNRKLFAAIRFMCKSWYCNKCTKLVKTKDFWPSEWPYDDNCMSVGLWADIPHKKLRLFSYRYVHIYINITIVHILTFHLPACLLL